MSRKKRIRIFRRKNAGAIGVGILALIAIPVTLLALMHKPDDVPVPPQVASYYSSPPSAQAEDILPTAVFIGDSYTEGAGATSKSLGWVNVAARSLNWSPVISADSASGFVAQGSKGMDNSALIAAADPKVSPEFVVIASGYNDAADDRERLAQAMAADIVSVQEKWPDAQLIAIGPWAPNGETNPNREAVLGLLESSITEHGGVFIDPLSQGWFDEPGIIGPDNLHPNDKGHALIGESVGAAIEAALKL